MTPSPLRTAPIARILVLAAGCKLHLAAAAATGQPPSPVLPNGTGETAQVLVITGSDPYLPAFMAIDAAARATLARRHHRPAVWLYESIDSVRLGGTTGPAFAELLARKYEGVRIDAVAVHRAHRRVFYLRHRNRLWPRAGTVYGYVAPAFASRLPPHQAIGSSIKTKYEVQGKGTAAKPVLVRLPELNFINDKSGKPVGIQQHIGRRSTATFGNPDGDFEMLAWTTGAPGARGWTVVNMRRDWKQVTPSR